MNRIFSKLNVCHLAKFKVKYLVVMLLIKVTTGKKMKKIDIRRNKRTNFRIEP